MSSAMSLSEASLAAAHEEFVGALPVMENVIRFQLRRLPKWCRAEMVNDALSACWHAWSGLIRRGIDPVTVGIGAIAANACRYTRNGRRLGTGTVGRGALDVFNPKAQKKLGFRVISLDCRDERDGDVTAETWRGWLAQDRRTSPGDAAAFTIDLSRWMAELPERKKTIAELLLEGHETGAVARMLAVTPSAVSQTRTWLELSWRSFQGEAVPGDAAPARRPPGLPAGSARGGGSSASRREGHDAARRRS